MSAQGAKVIDFPARQRDGSKWEPWLPETLVAEHFHVSTRTVRRWREQGCPSRMLGSSRRFRLSEVEDWHSRGDTE